MNRTSNDELGRELSSSSWRIDLNSVHRGWVLAAVSLIIGIGSAFAALTITADESKILTDIIQAKHSTVVLDTLDPDSPLYGHVRPSGDGSFKEPSVPFVDLDTNSYPKKLCFLPKQLISDPSLDARYPRIVARDSSVFISYRVHIGGTDDAIAVIYSTNYGYTWSPQQIVSNLENDSGAPRLCIGDSCIGLVYREEIIYPWVTVFYRKILIDGFVMDDPVIIDTGDASGNPNLPDIAISDTSLVFSYRLSHDGERWIQFMESMDWGESWSFLSGDQFTTAGEHFTLCADSSLSLVFPATWTNPEVRAASSFDGGLSFPDWPFISDSTDYASQSPVACTDGVSDLHASWYDYDGFVGGWGGYIFYRRSLDCGQIWEATKSLSTVSSAVWSELFADKDRVYSVFNDHRDIGDPYKALYLRISHDRGSSWSPEYKIIPETDPSWFQDLHTDGDYVYLTWMEQDAPEYIKSIYFMLGVWYKPGDFDLSETVNIADLTAYVSWLFGGAAGPLVPDAAQNDGVGSYNIADLTHLVSYLFAGGSPPIGGTPGVEWVP